MLNALNVRPFFCWLKKREGGGGAGGDVGRLGGGNCSQRETSNYISKPTGKDHIVDYYHYNKGVNSKE